MNVKSYIPLLSLAFLTGCIEPTLYRMQQKVAGYPTFEQSEPVTLISPFEMRITKSYWTNSVYRAGAEQMPASMREQYKAVPQESGFLVVEVAIKNMATTPASWERGFPPMFTLMSSHGLEYVNVPQSLNMQDISSVIMLGQFSLNPGGTFRGKVIFDVPQDQFSLVYNSTYLHRGQPSKEKARFAWKLTPTE